MDNEVGLKRKIPDLFFFINKLKNYKSTKHSLWTKIIKKSIIFAMFHLFHISYFNVHQNPGITQFEKN